MCDSVMYWRLTFSYIKFDNEDEFLRVNISYERMVSVLVMDSVTDWAERCEDVWISLYKLADFPKICVIEIIPFHRLSQVRDKVSVCHMSPVTWLFHMES